MTRGTIVVIDMVGFSNVARVLEESLDAHSVIGLSRQIQAFVDRALTQLPEEHVHRVVARTGDGVILLFEKAEDAHCFAFHIHVFASEHNVQRNESLAERRFRIGMATGDLSASRAQDGQVEYAGIIIANAVRLEGAGVAGEILVDRNTFSALSVDSKRLYGEEETVKGKRAETFIARRCRVKIPSQENKPVIVRPKFNWRTLSASGALAIATAPLKRIVLPAESKPSVLATPDKRKRFSLRGRLALGCLGLFVVVLSPFVAGIAIHLLTRNKPVVIPGAQAAVDLYRQKRFSAAFPALESACALDSGEACKDLGDLYKNGWGVGSDEARAFKLYFMACKTYQYVWSCTALGNFYEQGGSVPQDYQKAKDAYLAACPLSVRFDMDFSGGDARDREGCYQIAKLFQREHDDSKAREYFLLSCGPFHPDACDLGGEKHHWSVQF